MAESSHKLTLYIEAINKGDAVLRQFGSQVQNVANQVGAVGDKTKASLQNASSVFGEFKSGLESELSKVPLAFSGIGAAAIGSVAGVLSFKAVLDSLSVTLKESLLAFSEDKLALDQLAVAWKNAGRSMPVEELNKPIADLAKATTFDDTSIANAARMLAIHSAVTDDLMERSLKAAADLAAFQNTDIQTAAEYLGRAAEGQLFGLRRMGIALSATTMESKDFRDVLKDIEKSLGGQAVVAAESYHGQLKKIGILHGELKERLGSIFEPAAQVWAGDKVAWLTSLNDELQRSVESGYLGDVSKKLENIARALSLGKGVAEGWGDAMFRGIGEGLKNMAPILDKYLKLLEWIGQKRKEGAGETEGGTAGAGQSSAPGQPFSWKVESANQLKTASATLEAEWAALDEKWGEFIDPAKKEQVAGLVDEISRMAQYFALIQDEMSWTPPDGSGLEQYAAVMERVNQQLAGEKPGGPVDYKLQEIEAQNYFSKLTADMKAAYEAEKSEIESTAQTKEEAERRKFDAANLFSQKRVATALAEYERMLASKGGTWSKQENEVSARYRTEGLTGEGLKQVEANKAEALKELRRTQAKETADLEKKLTDTIREELTARFAEVRKYVEKVRALEDELFKLQMANVEGLAKLRQGTQTEGEKLTAQVDAMQAKLQQAVDLMPTMPERAKALFQEAQGLAQGLVQNIKSLEDNLKGVRDSFAQSFQALDKLGKTPEQVLAMDAAGVKKTIAEAQAALGEGNYAEAQKKAEAARQKIDSLVSQAEELYGPEQAKKMLGPLLEEARVLADVSAGSQLDQARDIQKQAEDIYSAAGKNLETIIADQINVLKAQMGIEQQLIAALQGLTVAMGAKAGQVPPGLQGAGAEAGAGQPGTPGTQGDFAGLAGTSPGMVAAGLPGSEYGGATVGPNAPATPSITPELSFFGQGIERTIADWISSLKPMDALQAWSRNVGETVSQAKGILQPRGNESSDQFSEAGEKLDGSATKFDDTTSKFDNIVNKLEQIFGKGVEVKVTINESGAASAQVWT